MRTEEIKATFDKQAAGYDERWAKMAPIRDGLHYLLDGVFAELPPDAKVLCVGVGTGAELVHLALKNPGWSFTAVEPSGPMLDLCRERAEAAGVAARCRFHEGYLDSLPAGEPHQAATCFLVSQFLLDPQERTEFFREIAMRLQPGGLLAISDLASDQGSSAYEELLQVWLNMLAAADIPPEGLENLRRVYENEVAILPQSEVAALIAAAGFEPPVQFYQAGLIHAWFSKRAAA